MPASGRGKVPSRPPPGRASHLNPMMGCPCGYLREEKAHGGKSEEKRTTRRSRFDAGIERMENLQRKVQVQREEGNTREERETMKMLEEEFVRLIATQSVFSSEDEMVEDYEKINPPIKKLRTPNEVEAEIITSTLVLDKKKVADYAGTYAYALIEKLVATLTNTVAGRTI